jgi:uncharacterized membrane protein (UPF0127 family)
VDTITLDTPDKQAMGLQYLPSIPDNVIYKFPRIFKGAVFHSRNVPEPFEIAFVTADGYIIKCVLMTPPDSVYTAPPGTSYVLEARPGVIGKLVGQ